MQKYVKLLTNGGFPNIDHRVGKVFPVSGEPNNLVAIRVPEHDMPLYFDISEGEAEYVDPSKVYGGLSVAELHKQLEELSQAFKEAQEALEAVLQQPKKPQVGDFVMIKSKEDLKLKTQVFTSRCGYVGKIVKIDSVDPKLFTIEFKQASFSALSCEADHFRANFYDSEFEVVPDDTPRKKGYRPVMGDWGVKADLKTLTNIPEEMVYLTGEFYDEFIKGRI